MTDSRADWWVIYALFSYRKSMNRPKHLHECRRFYDLYKSVSLYRAFEIVIRLAAACKHVSEKHICG